MFKIILKYLILSTCVLIAFDAINRNFAKKVNRFGNLSFFSGMALPLMRKAFPTLMATNIVGVMPITKPIGVAYATRFIYEKEQED